MLRKRIKETTDRRDTSPGSARAHRVAGKARRPRKPRPSPEAAYKKAATSSERLSSAVAKANSSYEKAKVEMNAVGIEAADLATASSASHLDERSRIETERSVAAYENAKQEVAEFNRLADARSRLASAPPAARANQVIVRGRPIAAQSLRQRRRRSSQESRCQERAEFERYQSPIWPPQRCSLTPSSSSPAEASLRRKPPLPKRGADQRRTQAYGYVREGERSIADAFSTAGVRPEATIRSGSRTSTKRSSSSRRPPASRVGLRPCVCQRQIG